MQEKEDVANNISNSQVSRACRGYDKAIFAMDIDGDILNSF